MKVIFNAFLNSIQIIFLSVCLVFVFSSIYLVGYIQGFNLAVGQSGDQILLLRGEFEKRLNEFLSRSKQTSPQVVVKNEPQAPRITWGGPELWEAVNKKRVAYGVNPLGQKDEICTIASIRLNELLKLGDLDGHQGFSEMPEKRADLKWIFEKYNLTEFLLVGAKTADEAVGMWDNTLAHKKLLAGGEYVWGCIYAQDSFAVAITAY